MKTIQKFLMALISVRLALILLALILVSQTETEDTKLLFVQMIFRHGDRAPVMLYPTDPNPVEFWKEGLGKLTKLGKKQHYVLGKYLRSMYTGFVTSNPNEVLVNSTDADRCLKSALANLAAFYAPDADWIFDEEIDWQPIPVYYEPGDTDKYLSVKSHCPRAWAEQERLLNNTVFLEEISKYKVLLDKIELTIGVDFKWMVLLQDTFYVEKKYGLTVPTWVDRHWDELNDLANINFFWLYNSELIQRLRGGPFLGYVIENMNRKILGDIPDLKVQVFSAHDANIIAVLEGLKLYNMVRPPYCATVLFELHEVPNGQTAVRILYINSTEPEVEGSHETHLLTLDGCSEFCPLEYFIAYTKHLIPEDWDRECQLTEITDKSILSNTHLKDSIHQWTDSVHQQTDTGSISSRMIAHGKCGVIMTILWTLVASVSFIHLVS